MDIRRVVTGVDDQGRSTIASDEVVTTQGARLLSGVTQAALWTTDDSAELRTDGSPAPSGTWFPPVGGFRFVLFVREPGEPVGVKDASPEDIEELQSKFPGLMDEYDEGEERSARSHATESTDLFIVLSGEIVLGLDETEVVLKAGDVVVQNGTAHTWLNRGTVPAVVAGVMVGACP